jgi:hypothetical protein
MPSDVGAKLEEIIESYEHIIIRLDDLVKSISDAKVMLNTRLNNLHANNNDTNMIMNKADDLSLNTVKRSYDSVNANIATIDTKYDLIMYNYSVSQGNKQTVAACNNLMKYIDVLYNSVQELNAKVKIQVENNEYESRFEKLSHDILSYENELTNLRNNLKKSMEVLERGEKLPEDSIDEFTREQRINIFSSLSDRYNKLMLEIKAEKENKELIAKEQEKTLLIVKQLLREITERNDFDSETVKMFSDSEVLDIYLANKKAINAYNNPQLAENYDEIYNKLLSEFANKYRMSVGQVKEDMAKHPDDYLDLENSAIKLTADDIIEKNKLSIDNLLEQLKIKHQFLIFKQEIQDRDYRLEAKRDGVTSLFEDLSQIANHFYVAVPIVENENLKYKIKTLLIMMGGYEFSIDNLQKRNKICANANSDTPLNRKQFYNHKQDMDMDNKGHVYLPDVALNTFGCRYYVKSFGGNSVSRYLTKPGSHYIKSGHDSLNRLYVGEVNKLFFEFYEEIYTPENLEKLIYLEVEDIKESRDFVKRYKKLLLDIHDSAKQLGIAE